MRAKRHETLSLTAYSHSARAALAKQRFKPGKAWIAYSAAAGAALAMAPSAEAIPVYSGLQNIHLEIDMYAGTSKYYGLDLDRNGVIDLNAVATYEFWSGFFLFGLGQGEVLFYEGTDPFVVKLASGDTIGSLAGPFYRAGILARLYPNSYPPRPPVGDFLPSRTGFAGVRFKQAGNDHFGWIRLHVGSGVLTIKDWAYESAPGAPIDAGEGIPAVPEPSGLALLATGAAGILAWRKRRHRRDS